MKFAAATLATVAFANSNDCPSDECWNWNSNTTSCDLETDVNRPNCDYTLTCNYDSFRIEFDTQLFGTADDPEAALEFFGSDANCRPTWNATDNKYVWDKELGACDQTIKRNGDRIEVEKNLSMTQGTNAGIDYGAISVFTSSNEYTITVAFKCVFASSFDVKADKIEVAPRTDTFGTAIEAEGSWTGSFFLKYYETANYATERSDSSPQIYLGQNLFVEATWSSSGLPIAEKLKWYVESCDVKDVSTGNTIPLVKDTCFAEAIGASNGLAGSTNMMEKVVSERSRFSYRSFSFDTAAEDEQELGCTIQFCIPAAADTDYDCYADIAKNKTSDCPNGVFNWVL